jgi:peptide/nickel transport system substrate-binding protein
MEERDIRALIDDVREGRLPRRSFIRRMVGWGIAAPTAGLLLLNEGIAQQPAPFAYKPTKRGGGGPLKLLWWQGPTLLNPHFAVGTKDQEGSRIFYEPLAGWDADGNLVPVLAAEVPTRDNGGLAADGKSVTWKLKKGVTWHDGQPFTADDVVFTWEFARDPASAAVSIATYRDVEVKKIDSHTVRVVFQKATPFWADALVGAYGAIIPKHHFAAYIGAKSRDAPANLKPVGTGPYKFVDFKPGDLIRGEANGNYHVANRPFFDTIEMKGGGDAASAARAVLQTGEYDWAWNLQVEDEVLKKLEAGGKGRVLVVPAGDIEFLQLNITDPVTEVDGERGNAKSHHFAFSDPAVRQAMAMLVDRRAIQDFIYGRTGVATANFLNEPARYRSPNNRFEFNVDKAGQVLDAAGWKKGSDGIREKGGKKMKFVFQTSINPIRQKVQAVIKQACQKVGIELELKQVAASVFFSSDVANPDTYTKFWADMQMYTTTQPQPDPGFFMNQYTTAEICNKANKWQGRNICRYSNPLYDQTFKAAEGEIDPVKRTALFIKLNDIVIGENLIVPIVYRPHARGVVNKLANPVSGWDLDLFQLQDWYREA